MANKITVLVDLVTDKAQSGIRGLRSAVSSAEGTVGKLKAGLGSLGVSAGVAGAAIGTAIAAGATKAVGAFQSLAIESGKFADATGLSVEAASRLTEVSGDVGVSIGAIEQAVAKMNQAIGKGGSAVDELGLSLQTAADGTADVNATFLDAVRRINAIEDPTKRATLAAQLFGRGYKDAAEIIFSNADELARKLGEVSDAKVIDEGELKKAREFRELMDNLKDRGEDVALTFGKAGTSVAVALDKWFTGISNAGAALGDFIRNGNLNNTHLVEQFNASQEAARDFDRQQIAGLTTFAQVREKVIALTGDVAAANTVALEWKQTQQDLGKAVSDTGEVTGDAADAVADLGDRAANTGPKIGDMAGALDDAEQHLADLNEQARDDALNALASAAQAVGDALDGAFANFNDDLDQLDRLDQIAEDFTKAQEEGGAAVRDLRRDLARFLQDLDGIPPDKKIEILAEIRNGNIDQLKTILDDLTKDRFINVNINPPKIAGFSSVSGLFSPTQATPIINGANPAPTGGGFVDARNITNIYPVGSTPTTQYIDQQTDWRRNGDRNG